MNMKILAIETSCDETGIAVLEISGQKNPEFKIFSNPVASQIAIHQKWGGIYPALAKREHQKNLVPVLYRALKEAEQLHKNKKGFINPRIKLKIRNLKKILIREEFLYGKLAAFLKQYQKPKVDFIAVTSGPGLEPCLWSGVNFARALARFWNLPIMPVNHIEAHIYSNFIKPPSVPDLYSKIFPAIVLVVSGGHTQLILMKNHGQYRIIGETRDDAAGECFDKTARILGLGYPGGPIIAKLADAPGSGMKINLPRPMLYSQNYDFSFSGLKTAVLYHFKKTSPEVRQSSKYIRAMAHEIQQSIIEVLTHKTWQAAREFKAQTVILGGGVAANQALRKKFLRLCSANDRKIKLLMAPEEFCTDNAAMVGAAGYYHRIKRASKSWSKIIADSNLRIT